MRIQGTVGPTLNSDGAIQEIRLGRGGEVVMSELHGKYYLQAFRGNLFHATMSAGVIFPAPAATVANPMTLYNPVGSGRNLVLTSFDMVVTVIPGTPLTGLYGLYVNSNTGAAAVTGTALASQSAVIGSSAAAVARPLTTTTLPVAPTLLWPFAMKVTGEVVTANPSPALPSFHIDFDGQVILAPGTSITPQQTVADTTNATPLCRFGWIEVPA